MVAVSSKSKNGLYPFSSFLSQGLCEKIIIWGGWGLMVSLKISWREDSLDFKDFSLIL